MTFLRVLLLAAIASLAGVNIAAQTDDGVRAKIREIATRIVASTPAHAVPSTAEPTARQKEDIMMAASMAGALLGCMDRGYAINDDTKEAFTRIANLFEGYEKMPDAPMVQAGAFAWQVVMEARQYLMFLTRTDQGLIPTQVTGPDVCVIIEEGLKGLMAPGNLLDGKFAPGQNPA